MTDAKATICYLNGLTLKTINEVEKIIRSLPREGDYVETVSAKPLSGDGGRGTADVVASKSMQIRDVIKPLCLSPINKKSRRSSVIMEPATDLNSCPIQKTEKSEKTARSASSRSTRSTVISTTTSTNIAKTVSTPSDQKFQCKVLTDQVRVSPIVAYNGVTLELDVEVTMPEGSKKKLKLEIECPNFIPARIKIGNKWKNIV